MTWRPPVAAIAVVIAATVLALASITAQSPRPVVTDDGRELDAGDRQRIERAIDVATRRYDEWLGPGPANATEIRVRRAWWSSPASMDLESQVAVALARARFSQIQRADALVDGIAWHLQSRVVEELFDYVQHQPGHHIDEVLLFDGHVRWGVPLLVLPRTARDDRVPVRVAHAAAAVATLDSFVGWPALAGALRVIASERTPLDSDAVRARLESALGVPLDWFFAAAAPDFAVNYALSSVTTTPQTCDGQPCHTTRFVVTREWQALATGVTIQIDFGGDQRSTLEWTGHEPTREFTFESGLAPVAITIDPERRVKLDTHPLDQRWRAEPYPASRPIKLLASWMVWLQNATLTYGVLL